MKKYLAAFFTCCLPLSVLWLACLTAASGEVIKVLPLNDSGLLGTVITADSTTKADGEGSIRIDVLWPTTICLGEVADLEIDESKLVYRASVKSDLAEGMAYLELWCHVSGGRYFSRGKDSVVQGSSEWTVLETPFFLQKGQKVEKVTLNVVIEGIGTVWVDAASLIRQPLQ
jgi:hypothetical protein